MEQRPPVTLLLAAGMHSDCCFHKQDLGCTTSLMPAVLISFCAPQSMCSCTSSQKASPSWCQASAQPVCSPTRSCRSAKPCSTCRALTLFCAEHSSALCKGAEYRRSSNAVGLWVYAPQDKQWPRLFWSAFLHADEMHLFYNMSSLLWKVGAPLGNPLSDASAVLGTQARLLLGVSVRLYVALPGLDEHLSVAWCLCATLCGAAWAGRTPFCGDIRMEHPCLLQPSWRTC